MLLFSLTAGSCLETAAQAAGFQAVVEKSGRTIVQAIQKVLDSKSAVEPGRAVSE
ncbi:MAG: hypothetical protein ACRD4X_13155 [Candidatus Acidiferrales bacterium]